AGQEVATVRTAHRPKSHRPLVLERRASRLACVAFIELDQALLVRLRGPLLVLRPGNGGEQVAVVQHECPGGKRTTVVGERRAQGRGGRDIPSPVPTGRRRLALSR